MLRNLEDRGCPLRGLLACDSLAAQTERLLTCGFATAKAVDMDTVYYQVLDRQERGR